MRSQQRNSQNRQGSQQVNTTNASPAERRKRRSQSGRIGGLRKLRLAVHASSFSNRQGRRVFRRQVVLPAEIRAGAPPHRDPGRVRPGLRVDMRAVEFDPLTRRERFEGGILVASPVEGDFRFESTPRARKNDIVFRSNREQHEMNSVNEQCFAYVSELLVATSRSM